MDGWVKLYRQTLDNPIVMKDADHLAIWTWLLLNACHSPFDTLLNGKRYTLEKGQLITTRKKVSKYLNVDEYKVERTLTCFESEHQIAQQKYSKCRVISILNWDEYQEVAQQNAHELHTNCTPSAQQVHTKQEDKEDKEDKEYIYTIGAQKKFVKPSVEEVAEYIAEKGYHFSAEAFVAFYESKGWKIGKEPMKSWKACCVTWETRYKEKSRNVTKFEQRTDNIDSDVLDNFNKLVGGM